MRAAGFDAKKAGWAWVAGASEGLGLAFAQALARQRYPLVLFARRHERLHAAAPRLRELGAPAVRCVGLDLAHPELDAELTRRLAGAPPALAVYNAAYAAPGYFLDAPLDDALTTAAVNVRGPLIWAHVLGRAMRSRGSGSLLFMSSLAGGQGGPGVSAYAASKAFTSVFAEGLWWELRAAGIDVLVCDAGAIRTPNLAAVSRTEPPGILDPDAVVSQALAHLERGPRTVPGALNAVASRLVGRWLPRRWAVALMARANRRSIDALIAPP